MEAILTQPGVTAIPPGTRLVHIGPPKTGTTTLQGALHHTREAVSTHGTVMPYRGTQPMKAVQALLDWGSEADRAAPTPYLWNRLVKIVNATDADRILFSSEFLAGADADTVERIVADLGGPAVRVVLTLRPFAKILPSQWQQFVQNRLETPYETWLEEHLRSTPEAPPQLFWRLHRYDALVERWAAAIGAANVTVIMVDDADSGMLLRTFEDLLALPSGLLQPRPELKNRSFSWDEAELLRRFNTVFNRMGLRHGVYRDLIVHGAVRRVKVSREPRRESRIATPDWALDRAAELGTEMAEKIRGMGVNVIGDLDQLGKRPSTQTPNAPLPAELLDLASEALAGVLDGAIAAQAEHRRSQAPRPAAAAPAVEQIKSGDLAVEQVKSKDLAKILAVRAARRLRVSRRGRS